MYKMQKKKTGNNSLLMAHPYAYIVRWIGPHASNDGLMRLLFWPEVREIEILDLKTRKGTLFQLS